MARPPQKPKPAPTLTEEQQREQLDKAHADAVARLERILDASIGGKSPDATGLLCIVLPLVATTPQVLADVCAHYVAAGWKLAQTSFAHLVVKSGALVQATDASGAALPDAPFEALYLVADPS